MNAKRKQLAEAVERLASAARELVRAERDYMRAKPGKDRPDHSRNAGGDPLSLNEEGESTCRTQ